LPSLDIQRKNLNNIGRLEEPENMAFQVVIALQRKVRIFLDDKFEPVIGDFALSFRFNAGLRYSAVGTPICMSPEITTGDEYDFAI
jgi:hypothetical protein